MSKDSNFFINFGLFSAKELADRLSVLSIVGDQSIVLSGMATLKDAQSSDISFLANPKYKSQFENTEAGACIVDKSFLDPEKVYEIVNRNNQITLLVSSNPYHDYALTLELFYRDKYDHKAARQESIDPSAIIGNNCIIGQGVIIGADAVIGDDCHIMANSYIGAGVKIGNEAIIHSNASITYCYIGDKCIIHSGVRIGQDGFGFAPSSKGIIKVKQIGCVIIGNNVEIGANTCIDRGAIGNTIIGDDCKLDNLVQIGHNVVMGKGCLVVAQVGISGSTKIGEYSMIGGQVGIAGHLDIGKRVQIAAQGGVIQNVDDDMIVGGTPAVPITQWHRQSIFLRNAVTKRKSSK